MPEIIYELTLLTDIDLFLEEYQANFRKLSSHTHIYAFKQLVREFKYHKKILKLGKVGMQQTLQMMKEI